MNEDIFSKLLPEEHLEEYLKKSKRLDGREFDDHRAMIIEIYKQNKEVISLMVNLGGTICQCLLTLNRITEQISGFTRSFEPITIRQKFSEKQNYGTGGMDIATFKYSLKRFVKKNYVFDKFFQKKNEMEKHQLSFDFIVFTNQGNELECLYNSGIIALYKMLSMNNMEQFQLSRKYFPLSHQFIYKQYLLVDPIKKEEEALNSVKIFFLYNFENDNFCLLKNSGDAIDSEVIRKCKRSAQKLFSENFKKELMKFICSCENKFIKLFQEFQITLKQKTNYKLNFYMATKKLTFGLDTIVNKTSINNKQSYMGINDPVQNDEKVDVGLKGPPSVNHSPTNNDYDPLSDIVDCDEWFDQVIQSINPKFISHINEANNCRLNILKCGSFNVNLNSSNQNLEKSEIEKTLHVPDKQNSCQDYTSEPDITKINGEINRQIVSSDICNDYYKFDDTFVQQISNQKPIPNISNNISSDNKLCNPLIERKRDQLKRAFEYRRDTQELRKNRKKKELDKKPKNSASTTNFMNKQANSDENEHQYIEFADVNNSEDEMCKNSSDHRDIQNDSNKVVSDNVSIEEIEKRPIIKTDQQTQVGVAKPENNGYDKHWIADHKSKDDYVPNKSDQPIKYSSDKDSYKNSRRGSGSKIINSHNLENIPFKPISILKRKKTIKDDNTMKMRAATLPNKKKEQEMKISISPVSSQNDECYSQSEMARERNVGDSLGSGQISIRDQSKYKMCTLAVLKTKKKKVHINKKKKIYYYNPNEPILSLNYKQSNNISSKGSYQYVMQ